MANGDVAGAIYGRDQRIAFQTQCGGEPVRTGLLTGAPMGADDPDDVPGREWAGDKSAAGICNINLWMRIAVVRRDYLKEIFGISAVIIVPVFIGWGGSEE